MKTLREHLRQPLVRTYMASAGGVLLISFLLIMVRSNPVSAALAVAIAIPGLLGRWTLSPVLHLLIVAYVMVDPYGLLVISPDSFASSAFAGSQFSNGFGIMDMLLTASTLCYLLMQYRLYSLLHRALPMDREPYHRLSQERDPALRPARLIRDTEIPYGLILVGVAVVVGQIAWQILWYFCETTDRRQIAPWIAAFIGVVWALTIALMLGAAIFGYLAMRQATREEAELYLRDGLWEQTGREQLRIQRWRQWWLSRRKR